MSDLPQLREELEFHSGPATETGQPTWLINDPVRNSYFQIDQQTFEALSRWHLGSAENIAIAVTKETIFDITEEFLTLVVTFLEQQQLVRIDGEEGRSKLLNMKKAKKQSWYMWLIHHYLFFRVPLIQPDKFLEKTLNFIQPFYSQVVGYILGIALVVGLFMLNQQWDVFKASFVDMLSIQGLIYFFFALGISKIGHELGHAYTAKRYGCRIPTMGVAFLVMWPMLYTDTNETWKLKSLKERRNVALAGMAVELALAILATAAWSFISPGALRDMTLVLATTTWVTSLLINISPFMRFDGYYLLSDWLNVPNLHARSFALTRWWLREVLFDLKLPLPEKFSRQKSTFLIAFGFFIWLYRLVLFLGIAVLVYHFFIKIIGIILFVVEIVYFIAKPIWSEVKVWLQLKDKILQTRRIKWTVTALIFLIFLFVLPWSSTIKVPALVEAKEHVTLYAKQEGKLLSISKIEGELVAKGDVLFTFENLDFESQLKTLEVKKKRLDFEKNAAFYSKDLRQQNDTVFAEVAKLDTEMDILRDKKEKLNIIAQRSGVFRDLEAGLSIGQWIGPNQRLAAILNQNNVQITAYIMETDIERLNEGATCMFYSNEPDLLEIETCKIDFIEKVASTTLNEPALSSLHGGQITVREVDNVLYPEKAIYKAHITVSTLKKTHLRQIVGTVHISGEKHSLFSSLWKVIASILHQEMTW